MSFVSISKSEYYKNTKMCKYYKFGCKNPKCNFAHRIEDLKPILCIYGDKCLRKKCYFYHKGDPELTPQELYHLSNTYNNWRQV